MEVGKLRLSPVPPRASNPGTRPPAPNTGARELGSLNPTQAGYAADAASQAANARPRPRTGSVTQSSNPNDRVTVTARHGARRNSYSIRNGSSWSIRTSDGNPRSIPDVPQPFRGQELSKRTNGGTLYVDVYSDIEAPTTRQVSTGGRSEPIDVESGDRVVFFDESSTSTPRPGTLNGQPGVFTCDFPFDCNILFRDSQGTVEIPFGVIFIPDNPDNGGSTRTESTSDTDYLVGGVWLFVPDNARSVDDVEIGAFGHGEDPFRQSDLRALQGTARYDGSATGVYTDRSEGEVGYWDGKVSLTANFGASSDLGTISGSWFDIEADGERYSGTVALEEASIGFSNSGFFEGRLRGTVDGTGLTGRWGGQFFGNDEADGRPGSVGGTLGGTSTDGNGSFVGAFGAHKQ